MKNYMQFALGLLIALSVGKVSAQKDGLQVNGVSKEMPKKDTLGIQLKGSDKIFIIGNSLTEISNFKMADSLKALFIADWTKAIELYKENKQSKTVHYFINQNGKRRFKFESIDFVEPAIDVAKEKVRMELDLPVYEYILHTPYDLEIQFYMNSAEELLNELNSVKLDDAIKQMALDKKELKRNYRYNFIAKDGAFSQNYRKSARLDMLELSPLFGLGMIGSNFAPVIGFDLNLIFSNRYNIPSKKLNFSSAVFGFADVKNGDITNIRPVQSYDIIYAINVNKHGDKPHWIGFGEGILKDPSGKLNNALKLDLFLGGFGPYDIGFDLIYYNKSLNLMSMKLLWSF